MECVNLLLLILFSKLSHTVRAEEKTLDMASDAVDDVFLGCRDKMLKAVTEPGGLLQKEIQARADFAEMWKPEKCKKKIHGLTEHHVTALESYGNSKGNFRKMFNDLVHASGSNTTIYKNVFVLKSLHFLLTDAMQFLNNRTCHQVYYGTGNQYSAESGEEIRFGKFIQAGTKESPQTEKIYTKGEGTLFIINSCSVVNVENYTCTSEEIDQLISPTEVFKVQKIQPVSSEDADYKIITLTHSHFLSNHNCYLFDSVATTPSNLDLTLAPGGSSSPVLSSAFMAVMASFLSLYYYTAQ